MIRVDAKRSTQTVDVDSYSRGCVSAQKKIVIRSDKAPAVSIFGKKALVLCMKRNHKLGINNRRGRLS